MTIVGKIIVREGPIIDRFHAYQILGRTDQFLKVVNIEARARWALEGDQPERRIKISSLGKHALFDDEDVARRFANTLNDRLSAQNERHKKERIALFDDFSFTNDLTK